MGVFVSWAIEGSLSHRMALHIKEWLPDVFVGQMECFVSSTDISAGSVWLQELFSQLERSQAGIVCVTRESMTRGWMLFEAGALAKMIGTQTQRVCPLLLDLDPGELTYPLAAFQWKVIKPDAEDPSKESVLALLKMVNESMEPSKQLEERRLSAQFQAFWPRFWSVYKEQRATQNSATSPSPVQVDNNEILVEIRSGFRQMLNMLAQEQQIEVPVTCPSCGAITSAEFYNAPGATRHFTCTICKARSIAHLAADRHAYAKITVAGATSPSEPAFVDSTDSVSLQVSCPSCGGSQVEAFSAQPGATRHLICTHCAKAFIAHRSFDGTARSKPPPIGIPMPPSFEGFLRKTKFWISPDKVGSLIEMARESDNELTQADAVRTPTSLKHAILKQRPQQPAVELNNFVKILLHGGAFVLAPESESSVFHTQYSNSLSREDLLHAFYRGVVGRLSRQFEDIGEKNLPDLREALQTATISGADLALEVVLKAQNKCSAAGHTDGPECRKT